MYNRTYWMGFCFGMVSLAIIEFVLVALWLNHIGFNLFH